MRRQLLASTVGIALACVLILGLPLVILARHDVWASARERVREQAASVATGLGDRLDAGAPIDLRRYLALMPHRRIIVRRTHRAPVIAGRSIANPVAGTVVVADATITVQTPRGPIVTRAREVTMLVVGLAALATLAAVGLALWQARRLARPLADLVVRADALGRGEFVREPLASGVPEIDRVSGVLERSARQIGTYVDLQQQFASDAAHQLRTPLTGIGLHLEEIARLGDEAVRDEAEDALAQVERIDGVISSLLARARGDSAAPAVIDLVDLVRQGCSPWEQVLARAGRRLLCDAQPPVQVLARREHVLGILTSLLDNAVVHGAGDVHLTVRRDGSAALVRIRDEGPGVPADLTTTIFDRQVSGSRGTGIGLALARSLAAAESGTLALSTTDPAEFVLTLPACNHTEVQGSSTATADLRA